MPCFTLYGVRYIAFCPSAFHDGALMFGLPSTQLRIQALESRYHSSTIRVNGVTCGSMPLYDIDCRVAAALDLIVNPPIGEHKRR